MIASACPSRYNPKNKIIHILVAMFSKKICCPFLILAVLSITLSGCSQTPTSTAGGSEPEYRFVIISPYADVDWTTFGQFKASLHTHTENSAGIPVSTSLMVEELYNRGFDIVAITNHNYVTRSWDQKTMGGAITTQRKAEVEAGVGRDGRGMLAIRYTNEQSRSDHINSFFVDFNNERDQSMEDIIVAVESLGGMTRLNHPGRYTRAHTDSAISDDPAVVQKYVDIFMAFPSCVGMEIINRLDNESRADRILWDNILKQTMPLNRSVWGFADDDSHHPAEVGYAWNVMLMPSLDQDSFRVAMEAGTFYAVSRVSRPDNINNTLPDGGNTPSSGRASTEYMLSQSTPSILNIAVDERNGTIAISGQDYDVIEWIADGVVIATDGTLSLREHQETINSYVRAQLKSDTGITFTQPFGVTIIPPL